MNNYYKITLKTKKLLKIKYFLCCLFGNRYNFLKKHNIFNKLGNNVLFQPIKLPNDPQYIRLHNNVRIASNVTFYNHDVINQVINCMDKKEKKHILAGHIECIEIYDNVFVGGNSVILGGVSIGPNAIVAAGSVVTKDVPEGAIVGGCPAKVIGNFFHLIEKRTLNDKKFKNIFERSKYTENERILDAWYQFEKKHKKIKQTMG